jgi:hypothetical protein
MTKLRKFLIGKANAAFTLLRAVRLRDVPWLLLGFVVMILISPEEAEHKSSASGKPARRGNASE